MPWIAHRAPQHGARAFTPLALATLLLLSAASLHAQQPQGPVPVRVGLTMRHDERSMGARAEAIARLRGAASPEAETEWLRGGIVGGLLLGGASALLVYALQGADDFEDSPADVPLAFLFMGSLGFGIGALIGGLFEK